MCGALFSLLTRFLASYASSFWPLTACCVGRVPAQFRSQPLCLVLGGIHRPLRVRGSSLVDTARVPTLSSAHAGGSRSPPCSGRVHWRQAQLSTTDGLPPLASAALPQPFPFACSSTGACQMASKIPLTPAAAGDVRTGCERRASRPGSRPASSSIYGFTRCRAGTVAGAPGEAF